jgi:thiol-disulfide isomerase/thioredoxin
LKILLLAFLLWSPLLVVCQIEHSKNHFLVEFDQFSPPIKETIESWEGYPAKNFMGLDLNGKSITLSALKGSKVVLVFLSTEDVLCQPIMEVLDEYQRKNEQIKVIVACYEDKATTIAKTQEIQTSITTLHSCKFLSEAVYEHHLGTPRMFIIDEKGITLKVVPSKAFQEAANIKVDVFNLINKMYKL